MTRDKDLIVQKVADKLEIPRYEVMKVINSMFGYMFEMIEAGHFFGFYMRYLGKFIVKPKRFETAMKKFEEKRERELDSFKDNVTDIS